jgi:hypothetical protein
MKKKEMTHGYNLRPNHAPNYDYRFSFSENSFKRVERYYNTSYEGRNANFAVARGI